MPTSAPPEVELLEIAGRYDGILFDAFGVLLTYEGAVPHAAERLKALDERGVPWVVVTNDASRHPTRAAAWYRSLGLPLPEAGGEGRVVSSGTLLAAWVEREGLRGEPVLLLGSPDSARMLEEGGGRVAKGTESFAGVALCDEAGYDILPSLETALNAFLQAREEGRRLPMCLANPDVVYPQSPTSLGIAAGGIGAMLEAAVRARTPDVGPVLEPLGKPHRPIFEEAARRFGGELGDKKLLMVGDQLATDVKGALDAGLDAALVGTGVHAGALGDSPVRPTYVLSGWGRPVGGEPPPSRGGD